MNFSFVNRKMPFRNTYLKNQQKELIIGCLWNLFDRTTIFSKLHMKHWWMKTKRGARLYLQTACDNITPKVLLHSKCFSKYLFSFLNRGCLHDNTHFWHQRYHYTLNELFFQNVNSFLQIGFVCVRIALLEIALMPFFFQIWHKKYVL